MAKRKNRPPPLPADAQELWKLCRPPDNKSNNPEGLDSLQAQYIMNPTLRALVTLTHWHRDETTDTNAAYTYAKRCLEHLRVINLDITDTTKRKA